MCAYPTGPTPYLRFWESLEWPWSQNNATIKIRDGNLFYASTSPTLSVTVVQNTQDALICECDE